MARKTRQKMEDKPMDFLNDFNMPTTPAEPKVLYKVKVTHPSLRMRRAPNTQAEVVDLIKDQGVYEIVDEANGWGQLKNSNWIMLSYTEIV